MSLYNALFGVNPYAGLLLQALDLTPDQIPRFRDCFLNDQGRICVYTRTGGGNRNYYDERDETEDTTDGPCNQDLRQIPGYIKDLDDDYDCTYATFFFDVPEAFKGQIDLLQNLGAETDPAAAWEQMLGDLQSGKDTPETQRALKVGQQILGQIKEAMDK